MANSGKFNQITPKTLLLVWPVWMVELLVLLEIRSVYYLTFFWWKLWSKVKFLNQKSQKSLPDVLTSMLLSKLVDLFDSVTLSTFQSLLLSMFLVSFQVIFNPSSDIKIKNDFKVLLKNIMVSSLTVPNFFMPMPKLLFQKLLWLQEKLMEEPMMLWVLNIWEVMPIMHGQQLKLLSWEQRFVFITDRT